jgi:hypothetical protein
MCPVIAWCDNPKTVAPAKAGGLILLALRLCVQIGFLPSQGRQRKKGADDSSSAPFFVMRDV